jgi:hypothetical protein
MFSELFSKKYRSVLSTGATEADVHEGKPAVQKVLDRRVNETEHVGTKGGDLSGSLEIRRYICV